jgi:hypothetical protein
MRKIFRQVKLPSGISRRNFLSSLFLALFSLLIKPLRYAHSFFEKKGEQQLASASIIKGEFKFFSPYQAAVVEEVTSLIIPSDERPGAKEAGVVVEIDGIVSQFHKTGKIYAHGITWLDFMAWKNYKRKGFLHCALHEKIAILKRAGSGETPDMYDKSPTRKSSEEVVRIFFELIKQQTFEAFYASRTGWEITGYKGPPQLSGFKDYYRCL